MLLLLLFFIVFFSFYLLDVVLYKQIGVYLFIFLISTEPSIVNERKPPKVIKRNNLERYLNNAKYLKNRQIRNHTRILTMQFKPNNKCYKFEHDTVIT